VFTPFWRHCKQVLAPERPLDVPELTPIIEKPASEKLAEWGLIPSTPDWSQGINDRWQPGELGASERWETFLDESIDEYQQGRDFPSKPVTSYLSPHLVFGEISPRVLWHDLHDRIALGTVDADNANKFLSEIGWREYSRYLLFHFPHITESSFNKKFECFPWQNNDQLLQAWQQGNTGYPIIDAGMRELWQTGYMHNRVRMIVASFLTKHCLIHWSKGMDWFWDTLVDADIANNTASWQWIAGSGADAAPYFRIFNPILQGEKFDKEGGYVKKWVPELALLDSKYLHKPWEASPEILEQAEVELGLNYSYPIVDHKEARLRALAAYSQSKELSKFN
jgi:deoxyribodipyrimidine photo-lyase